MADSRRDIALATACGSETLPERGCQQFAELVDDVALSANQPRRFLEGVSGESVSIMIEFPNSRGDLVSSEARCSTRFALSREIHRGHCHGVNGHAPVIIYLTQLGSLSIVW